MRIAVLSDIHGNIPAFEAAIEHAKKQRVDQIVIAGDLVIGAPDFQFTGFLRTYNQWSKEAPLSLDEAYDRFLNM